MTIKRMATTSPSRSTGRVLAMPVRGKRILVVDDERAIADSLAFMLSHEGYEVRPAYSDGEAVEIAKQFKPELLITDGSHAGHFWTRSRRQYFQVSA